MDGRPIAVHLASNRRAKPGGSRSIVAVRRRLAFVLQTGRRVALSRAQYVSPQVGSIPAAPITEGIRNRIVLVSAGLAVIRGLSTGSHLVSVAMSVELPQSARLLASVTKKPVSRRDPFARAYRFVPPVIV